jgi:hypothetical protein
MEMPSKIFWKNFKINKEWMILRYSTTNKNSNFHYFNQAINRLIKNYKILQMMIRIKKKEGLKLKKNQK